MNVIYIEQFVRNYTANLPLENMFGSIWERDFGHYQNAKKKSKEEKYYYFGDYTPSSSHQSRHFYEKCFQNVLHLLVERERTQRSPFTNFSQTFFFYSYN